MNIMDGVREMQNGHLIVGLDFDGTCVTHKYPEMGEEVPGCIEWLTKWQNAGVRLMLWTMRDNFEARDAEDWLREREIKLWGVNTNPEQRRWTHSNKQYAHVYVDDAAYGCPLIEVPGHRPCVDWSKVGPAILTMITEWNKFKKE